MYGSFASRMALRTAAFGSNSVGQASTPPVQRTQRQTDWPTVPLEPPWCNMPDQV